MRSEIACLGCGQATLRLAQSVCRFGPDLAFFADRAGALLLARAMLHLPCWPGAAIRAYRPHGKATGFAAERRPAREALRPADAALIGAQGCLCSAYRLKRY